MEVLSDLNDCYDAKLSKAIVIVERLSEEVIKKYDKDLFERFEPSKGYITETQFMSYLGLISTKQLKSKPMEELKQSFPIRDISRIGPQLKSQKNHLILEKTKIIDNYIKKVVTRAQKTTKDENNCQKEVKNLTQKEIVRQKRLDVNNRKRKLRSDENFSTKIKSLITRCDMTSEWFNRLYHTFGYHLLSASEVSQLSLKPFSVGYSEPNEYSEYKYNDWKPSDIEMKSMWSEMAFKLNPKKRIFLFTRRQRIEKRLRMSCRLSWKKRLEMSPYTKPFTIKTLKLKDCPLCWRSLTQSHSCDDPSPSMAEIPPNILIPINDTNQGKVRHFSNDSDSSEDQMSDESEAENDNESEDSEQLKRGFVEIDYEMNGNISCDDKQNDKQIGKRLKKI